jgi:hypothetical protein
MAESARESTGRAILLNREGRSHSLSVEDRPLGQFHKMWFIFMTWLSG